VLATLDDTPLPIGLRDIPAIAIRDLSDSRTPEELAQRVADTLRGEPSNAPETAFHLGRAPETRFTGDSVPSEVSNPRRSRRIVIASLIVGCLILATIPAVFVINEVASEYFKRGADVEARRKAGEVAEEAGKAAEDARRAATAEDARKAPEAKAAEEARQAAAAKAAEEARQAAAAKAAAEKAAAEKTAAEKAAAEKTAAEKAAAEKAAAEKAAAEKAAAEKAAAEKAAAEKAAAEKAAAAKVAAREPAAKVGAREPAAALACEERQVIAWLEQHGAYNGQLDTSIYDDAVRWVARGEPPTKTRSQIAKEEAVWRKKYPEQKLTPQTSSTVMVQGQCVLTQRVDSFKRGSDGSRKNDIFRIVYTIRTDDPRGPRIVAQEIEVLRR